MTRITLSGSSLEQALRAFDPFYGAIFIQFPLQCVTVALPRGH